MKLLLLNNDVIINIIKHYLKSKNILYFCDHHLFVFILEIALIYSTKV